MAWAIDFIEKYPLIWIIAHFGGGDFYNWHMLHLTGQIRHFDLGLDGPLLSEWNDTIANNGIGSECSFIGLDNGTTGASSRRDDWSNDKITDKGPG